MKYYFKISLFVTLVFICNYSSYCQKYTQAQVDSMVKLFTSSENEELPPAFTGSNTTLVIFKTNKKNVDKFLENDIEKYYKGKYLLLEVGEALNPKDTSDTRFFVMVLDRLTYTSATTINRGSSNMEYQITMTDKKLNKIYRYKYSDGCYNCLFKDFFKKLEKLRGQTQ